MACALADELLFGSSSCWRHPFSGHLTFPSLPTNYCFSYVHPLGPCPPFWVFSGQKEGTPTYAVTGSNSYLLSLCSPWDALAFWTFSPHVFSTFHWLLPVACTHLYQLPWTRGALIPSIFDFTLPYSYLDTFDHLALMTAPVIVDIRDVDIKSCQSQNTAAYSYPWLVVSTWSSGYRTQYFIFFLSQVHWKKKSISQCLLPFWCPLSLQD